jgi:signal-transduction protein with cAMP-binding, CBS, and nucleotidyltransferase domain
MVTTRSGAHDVVMTSLHRHVDQKLELLHGLSLFAACSRTELAALGRELDMSIAPAGTVLMALQVPVRHWTVLGRGRAAVSTVAGVTGLVGPGESFGERALVRRARSAVAVTALEDVTVLTLQRRAFLRMAERHPTVGAALVAALACRPAPYEPLDAPAAGTAPARLTR